MGFIGDLGKIEKGTHWLNDFVWIRYVSYDHVYRYLKIYDNI